MLQFYVAPEAMVMTELPRALVALDIPTAVESTLRKFMDLFDKWNRHINLSAARTERQVVSHVLDSLHVIPHLRALAGTPHPRILDVGAGGGLPAVVLAACLPDSHITALEPIHKKHAFLRAAARELSLSNFDPLAERIEQHRLHDYDAATSRATFDLRDWLLLGLERVRPGGIVLGFEAEPRSDLPTGTTRAPYALDNKARAIVTLHRPVA